jgi:hypothetical protein
MTSVTIGKVSDALVSTWRAKGFDLQLIEKKGAERAYETCLHKGSHDIALIAFFRVKLEKGGGGYFEFGLQLSWPTAEEIRNRVRPPRLKPSGPTSGTPCIATLSVVRSSEAFGKTTPVVFDGLSIGDAERLFADNRDSYLLRAIPRSLFLCSPEGLCAALQRDDWQTVLFLPPWVVPIVFAAAGAEKALTAWGQSDAVHAPGGADLLQALRELMASRASRDAGVST